MKNKIIQILCALPFCIPYPFIMLMASYHNIGSGLLPVLIFPLLTLGVILCVHRNKKSSVVAGGIISGIISLIAVAIIQNGLDRSWFEPITPIIAVLISWAAMLGAELFTLFIFNFNKEK